MNDDRFTFQVQETIFGGMGVHCYFRRELIGTLMRDVETSEWYPLIQLARNIGIEPETKWDSIRDATSEVIRRGAETAKCGGMKYFG